MATQIKTRPSVGSFELWATEDVAPSERNARKHSREQVQQIAASMRQFGFTIPLLVDEDGDLIAGHGRLLAAKEIHKANDPIKGIDGDYLPPGYVPVMVARGWTEAQKRAYRIADNKLTENSEWDDEKLREEFGALIDFKFEATVTGFDADAIADFTGLVSELEQMPALASGEKSPFQQMTFTLHDTQAAIVRKAMELARGMGPFDESVNENGNGNALARACAEFVKAHADS